MKSNFTRQDALRRRMRGIALLDKGHSQTQVAMMLGVTPSAVSHWEAWRRKGGDAALAAKPHPGPKPKLTADQLSKLEALLVQGAAQHGHLTELWTLERVADLIRKKFGVRYDPSGVWHVLRRMGWSFQKPERRARERDEESVATWRKKEWPRIKKRAT